MDSEVTNDKEKKREITDAISNWIPVLTVFIPLAVPVGNAVGNAILNFFNYDYAGKAEEFYEIPSRYFVNSIIDDKFVTFVYIVAYLMLLGSPLIIRKLFKINRFDFFTSLFCSLFITLFVSMTVIQSIIKIIGIFNLEAKDNITDTVIIAVGVSIAIITFVLYMYLFMKDFSGARKEDLEKQVSTPEEEKVEERNDKKKKKKKGTKKFKKKEVAESDNHEIKGDIVGDNTSSEDRIITQNVATKSRFTKFIGLIEELYEKIRDFIKKLPAKIRDFIKELPAFISTTVLTIAFIAPFFITSDRIVEIPQNKTKYEIVTINDGDKESEHQMAVVSYKNSKAILMDCTIITQAAINGNEIEILQLTKGKYRLSDIEGHQIEYKEFDAVNCE